MKISLNEYEVQAVLSILEKYYNSVLKAFEQFQFELGDIAARTRYQKLNDALLTIANRFQKDVCGTLGERLLEEWRASGASLHSVAQKMGMGRQAETTSSEIEEELRRIFLYKPPVYSERLACSGEPEVEIADFDAVLEELTAFRRTCEEETSDCLAVLKRHGEEQENELWNYFRPIVAIYGRGVRVFVETAEKSLQTLREGYIQRLRQVAEAAEGGRRVSPAGLQDSPFQSMGTAQPWASPPAGSAVRAAGPQPAASTPAGGGQQRRAAAETGRRENPYAALRRALLAFDATGCHQESLLRMREQNLQSLEARYSHRLACGWQELDWDLKQYNEVLCQELNALHNQLYCQLWSGMISWAQADREMGRAQQRAEKAYQRRLWENQKAFAVLKQQAQAEYNRDRTALDRDCARAQRRFSQCADLYQGRQKLAQELERPSSAGGAVNTVGKLLRSVQELCTVSCPKLRAVQMAYQQVLAAQGCGWNGTLFQNQAEALRYLYREYQRKDPKKKTIDYALAREILNGAVVAEQDQAPLLTLLAVGRTRRTHPLPRDSTFYEKRDYIKRILEQMPPNMGTQEQKIALILQHGRLPLSQEEKARLYQSYHPDWKIPAQRMIDKETKKEVLLYGDSLRLAASVLVREQRASPDTQSYNQYGFQGICGLVSLVNVMRMAGKRENGAMPQVKDVVQYALESGLCHTHKQKDAEDQWDLPHCGGTSFEDRRKLFWYLYGVNTEKKTASNLEKQGVQICPEDAAAGGMELIARKVERGHGVIMSVNAGLLWTELARRKGRAEQYSIRRENDLETGQPVTSHAITITGTQRDPETGKLLGLVACDSGIQAPYLNLDAELLKMCFFQIKNGYIQVTDQPIRS